MQSVLIYRHRGKQTRAVYKQLGSAGRRSCEDWGLEPLKIYRRVGVCFDSPPVKSHILSFKTVVG